LQAIIIQKYLHHASLLQCPYGATGPKHLHHCFQANISITAAIVSIWYLHPPSALPIATTAITATSTNTQLQAILAGNIFSPHNTSTTAASRPIPPSIPPFPAPPSPSVVPTYYLHALPLLLAVATSTSDKWAIM